MFDADRIARRVIVRLQRRYEEIGRSLYLGGVELHVRDWMAFSAEPATRSPLREQITLLVRVANGELNRQEADERLVQIVNETVAQVLRLLFVPLFSDEPPKTPDGFWKDDLGQVIALCQVWSSRAELINYSQAAALLLGKRDHPAVNGIRAIARLVKDGALAGYVDPAEPNLKHARRVDRRQVEALMGHQDSEKTTE